MYVNNTHRIFICTGAKLSAYVCVYACVCEGDVKRQEMEASPHSAGDEAESSHCNLEVQSVAESVCTLNLPSPQIK